MKFFRGVRYDYGDEKYYVYYNSELRGVFEMGEEEKALALYKSIDCISQITRVNSSDSVFQAKEGINFKSTKQSCRNLNKLKKEMAEGRIKASKRKEVTRKKELASRIKKKEEITTEETMNSVTTLAAIFNEDVDSEEEVEQEEEEEDDLEDLEESDQEEQINDFF